MKKLFTIFITLFTLISTAQPVLRIGVMSDTHVTGDISSCSILKDALNLFKKHNVDLIINAGDISDIYDAESYINYRKTYNAVFSDPAGRPREIFAYAYHDIINHKGSTPFDAFKDVKKYLEATNDPYDIIKHKGYTFICLPQYHQPAEYKKLLDEAEKSRDGKPFFIIDHVPLHGTVTDSLNGNYAARDLVSQHPSAIHISGHNHSLLTNDLNIWQGEFTAVNAGFLHGSMRVKKSYDVAMVMEVYKDKIIFRRFFTDTQKEYFAENSPWQIPLPFNPETAPYSAKNRLERSPVPNFPDKAVISVNVTENGADIKFPHAACGMQIHKYHLELQQKIDGKWQFLTEKTIFGPYLNDARSFKQYGSAFFSIGYFEVGKDYRVSVTPFHFSGKSGTALSAEFKVSAYPKCKVVFESRSPMQDCRSTIGITGKPNHKTAVIPSDGFCHIEEEKISVRLHFPKGVWYGKQRGRIIFDVQSIFDPDRTLHLQLRCLSPRRFVPTRILTLPGNTAKTRYVIETNLLDRSDYQFYLNMKEGGPGKVKIDYVRIERY